MTKFFTLLLFIFISGCSHWGWAAKQYEIKPIADTALMDRVHTKTCQISGYFNKDELEAAVRVDMLTATGADGLTNCWWKIDDVGDPIIGEICIVLNCRPYKLVQK